MRVYLKMMLLNLESQMQYKVSFLMTVFGQFITAFAGLLSIKFMFEHVNMIYGFNDTDVILCYSIVVLSFSIGEAFGGGLATFGGILGDGSFDRALVRPRSVLFFSLFLFKATFTFFTVQDLSFLNLFTYGAREFGKYPFSIYGKVALSILTYIIPMALFQYYPLLYLIGRKSEAYYIGFPLLSLVFLIPCCLFFKLGLKRYQSIGS